MADVTLTLKADTGNYVKDVRAAQKATQDLYTTTEKGRRREKGLIEDIEGELKRLQEVRRKAFTVEEIEKYNRKIQEAKKDLEEYEKAGIKVKDTTETLTKSIGKWILSLGGATAILHKLKEAFLETTAGINAFNTASAVTKTVLNDIVTTGTISIATIRQSIATQKVLNDLRVEEYAEGIKVSKLNIKYQENYVKALDQTLSKEEKLTAVNNALEAHNEKIDIQVEHLKEQAGAVKQLIDKTTVPSEKMVGEYAKLIEEINNLEAERDASTKRLQSRRSGILQEEIEAEKKWRKDLHDNLNKMLDDYNKEQLEKQQKYNDAVKKLQDDYDKSVIESLTGEDKLKAQRDYQIKQLKLFRDELDALGELTPEIISQLETLASNIYKEFAKQMVAVGKLSDSEKQAVSDALLQSLPDLAGIQKSYIKTLDRNEEFDFNLWDKLGFSDEDIESVKESLGDAFGEIEQALNDYYEIEFENAERHRELLDTRVSETQQALDDEIELYKAGYASNVDAKKKELEELQKARDVALAEEEKAKKRQMIIEAALQAASLASAVANLFSKETRKLGLPGLITAGIGVASMLVSFAASVAKIKTATAAYELAEGGSGSDTGMITGKRHSQGGERFLDHVEVERGEAWGVLSRPASEKYGKVFHEMVSSFNKDEMPSFMPVTNQVRVENSGPNSRLDKVNSSINKLNQSILTQTQVSLYGNRKVIKKGNKVRIVG